MNKIERQKNEINCQEFRRVLEDAARLLEIEKEWMQGLFWPNKFNICEQFPDYITEPDSCCLMGAVKIAGKRRGYKVYHFDKMLEGEWLSMHPLMQYVFDWNDEEGRTKEEVVAKLRSLAARMGKIEENPE